MPSQLSFGFNNIYVIFISAWIFSMKSGNWQWPIIIRIVSKYETYSMGTFFPTVRLWKSLDTENHQIFLLWEQNYVKVFSVGVEKGDYLLEKYHIGLSYSARMLNVKNRMSCSSARIYVSCLIIWLITNYWDLITEGGMGSRLRCGGVDRVASSSEEFLVG